MGVRVNLKPNGVIMAELGIKPDGDVQKFFTHTCRIHMDKYVPMSEGNLALRVWEEPRSLHYLSRYAHYMYIGKVMGPNIPIKDKAGNVERWISKAPKYYTGKDFEYNKEKHPLATSYWDKKMWSAEKDVVIAEVQAYLKNRKAK